MTEVKPMTTWVARVPQRDARIVGLLRNEPGLMVCNDEVYCWIRAASSTASLSETLAGRLRLEIGAELFHVERPDQIRPWGKRVPTGLLPVSGWTPLAEAFVPRIPVAGYGAPRPAPLSLRIVRSDAVVGASVLRCDLTAWDRFVRTAPSLRLARWSFAATTAGAVLVRGTPLPTLPGQHYWECSQLIIPCGWNWSPTLSASAVRLVLGLRADDWAIACETTSTWSVIPSDAFISARRQNVRRTVQELSVASEASL